MGLWSGLWVWRGCGGCGEWGEGVVGGGIGGLEDWRRKSPKKIVDQRESEIEWCFLSCLGSEGRVVWEPMCGAVEVERGAGSGGEG